MSKADKEVVIVHTTVSQISLNLLQERVIRHGRLRHDFREHLAELRLTFLDGCVGHLKMK